MPRNTPLRIVVEGDELVLRIGIDTLAEAADRNDVFGRWCPVHGEYTSAFFIKDRIAFALDVAFELSQEQYEDGSTRIINALDHAFEEVVSGGYDSVAELPECKEDEEDI